MPATAVEVLHDDGRWYPAQLLGQHRDRARPGCGGSPCFQEFIAEL